MLGFSTVAAARALNVPRIARAVREQRRRHREVLRLCKVEPRQVRLLAARLGVRLPMRADGVEPVPGAPSDVGLRNTCHVLGTAMSMLFKGERNYAYPVRVAGSGVAGLVFFMSDGSVIKVSQVYAHGRRPKDGGGLVAGRGKAIPLEEFAHEVAMTRAARLRFRGTSAFRVPRVPRVVVLRGPSGARVGVMQQSRAPGVTMAAYLRDPAHSREERLAAAAAHGRALGALHAAGWVHGDLHTENVLAEQRKKGRSAPPPKVTIIDWGRSNTRRRIMAHAPSQEMARALWAKFVRYEVAFPYNDMASHGAGRAAAEAYLEAYLAASGAARGQGPVGEGLVDPAAVRRDYHGQVQNNVAAMFRALDLVSPHTAAGRKRGEGKGKRGSRTSRASRKGLRV